MPYWSSKADGNDYAFDSIGAYIYLIKERMMNDIKIVLEEKYPEQSLVSSLICLRQIGEKFPNNLTITFGKKDFEFAKKSFNEWYFIAKDRLPEQYGEEILNNANEEFELFYARFYKDWTIL